MSEKLDVNKIRTCSALLPPPGEDVVRECLDEIVQLRQEQEAVLAELIRVREAADKHWNALVAMEDAYKQVRNKTIDDCLGIIDGVINAIEIQAEVDDEEAEVGALWDVRDIIVATKEKL